MLVDSTSIPLRNLQSSPPASCHGKQLTNYKAIPSRFKAIVLVVIADAFHQFEFA